ncbi:hypothetical protein C2E25_11840 [Geothermobacter hydrogeniphilus]|uniref:Peptidase M1 membrane alanine aminopeptidase domain-containing protein n=1 Tax=Geothermobacter hydrogeniphilus TaxID=1969733 RepID=A0A2K2H8H1_9BACT|nr:M1 family aminopeptidase [Geothermobacter hydrogeniphilus]PNU19523.1 hypothetical protein C2E25_11840 [Geothermobacter hydrogeniphilus]
MKNADRRIIKDSPPLRILLFLLLLFPGVAVAADPPSAAIHHQLDIRLDPEKGLIAGLDRISYDTPLGNLDLRLNTAATGITVRSGDRPLPFQRRGDRLLITAGTAMNMTVKWRILLDAGKQENPEHDEDPSYGVRLEMTARGGFLDADTAWYPYREEQSSTFSILVRLPVGYWAVTAGEIADWTAGDKENRIRFRIDYPLPGLTLAVGPWRLREDRSGPIPLYTFFGRDNNSLSATYLSAARSFLALYESLFGPYPFHKFAMVENFIPTGYGFPSWTLLGSRVIRLPFIVKTSLGHEIAHSWWGNGVRVDARHGNWSEGLTTYVADYLYKERQGKEAAKDYRRKILREYATLVPEQAMPLNRFRSRFDKASQAIGYGKAAMVFHLIRRRIGDRAFWSALRRLAGEKMYRRADWQDLLDTFSAVSGIPLENEIRPWLERDDIPDLQLNELHRTATDGGWRIKGVLRQRTGPYPLRLPVVIRTSTGRKERTLRVTATSTEFSFNCDRQPLAFSVDPDNQVMRRLTREEIPLTINNLRAAPQLRVVEHPGLQAGQKQAVRRLLDGLRKTTARITTGTSLKDANPSETVLYVSSFKNIPEQWRPPGLTSSSTGGFQFNGREITAEISLLCVWPKRRGGLQALFVPADSPVATVVARKIPHYGRYSYLLFSGSQNYLKGTLRAGHSPLSFSWPDHNLVPRGKTTADN